MLYGGMRDLILGLEFINGKGQLISAGGRVVKNVAGYDITRLLVGSSGTLGMITAITLKLATLPERCCAVLAQGTLKTCGEVAAGVIQSNLWPAHMVAVPLEAAETGGLQSPWEFSIGFEGVGTSVESQLEKTVDRLQGSSMHSVDVQEYDPAADRFSEQYSVIDRFDFQLRADVPLDQVDNLYGSLSSSLPFHFPFLDFGNGRIALGMAALTGAEWLDIVDQACSMGGHALIEKAPDEFKQENDVFGRSRPEWSIMHRLKSILDPHTIFAPGRLPGKLQIAALE